MTRKIIQITGAGVTNTAQTQTDHILDALCDDGSVWRMDATRLAHGDPSPWKRLPDIPKDDDQARAAEED